VGGRVVDSGETTEGACARKEVVRRVFSAETKFNCVALHWSDGRIGGWGPVVLGWRDKGGL
jgi:hypothetical protein